MVINKLDLNDNSNSTKPDGASPLNDRNDAILDAIDDLLEVKYLIKEVEKEESGVDQNEKTFPYQYKSEWGSSCCERAVRSLKARVERNLDTLERVARFSSQSDLDQILESVRKDHLQMKAELREGFKIKGAMLSVRDWQSPIYAASYPTAGNRLNHKIEEHIWDYKRDGHLDALAYEEAFTEEYLGHLGSTRLRAYLAGSGMAAFSTVLHWLEGERKVEGNVLALTPMYFENIHLARAFFKKVSCVSPESKAELEAALESIRPSVIFLDTVTNSGAVREHDLEAILAWARSQGDKELTIVIDTTCQPCMLLPENLLKDLPANISVIIVESLAKHHQFGMDAVTGGIIVIDAEEHLHKSFKPTRARLGTNITDASAGSLPTPNKIRLERRLRRHSKNMERIVRSLNAQIEAGSGIIDSLSWVEKGPEQAPWFRSSIMSLSLCPQFQSVWHYQEFENKVHELACQADLPVAFSTSFGFDITRLYVTAPSTAFEPPFLRLSTGTETGAQIEKLAAILKIASEQLAASWTLRNKVIPASIKQIKLPEAKRSDIDNRQYTGVFAGDESLQSYLDPKSYPPTPFVELPSDLNPFEADGVRIFTKFMPLVPLFNIKSIPAYSMLAGAFARGDLKEVENIIESSSSNTVMSLSVLARLFGVEKTNAIVDHSLAPGLERMLRLFGIEIFKHPSLGHELFGKVAPRRDRARAMGAEPGWYNPNQYENPDNPGGFARYLAPQILEQAGGKLDVLSLGLGTCGTMVGLSSVLKEAIKELHIIACCPRPGEAVPGPREESLLGDVSFDWQKIADSRIDLPAQESFRQSRKLLQRGIMAGPSSGMNYSGLLQYLGELKEKGELKPMRTAFICCDSPLQHIDEYFDILDESDFPRVHEVEAQKSGENLI
ncbi:MAG: pyridoxal-phosphate dependent enzyme [Candidatus Obscuribacterales bacterium]|nr:pyridoxal-phosphate dependent enzyme [Candidatus Obscuribacterales bacterium]